MDYELPDIFPSSAESTPTRTRKRRTGLSVGRKEDKRRSTDSNNGEGIDSEYTVEAIKDVEWDEKRLKFNVKWKFYSEDYDSVEKLSNLVSLQVPYKYMTEDRENYDSECFAIFTGLHKVGYRCHISDDRFHFGMMREKLIKDPWNEPYLNLFDTLDSRDLQLACYNTRLQRVDGPFMFKIENDTDFAMPSPFLGLHILDEENDLADQLPSFTEREVMTITRLNATWCIRTESVIDEGRTLFDLEGKVCPASTAQSYVVEWGELAAFNRFVYIGEDKGKEWALDRRGVYDPVSCFAHSCTPNCKVVVDVDRKSLEVVTKKAIGKKEVLTLDFFADMEEKMTKDDLVAVLDTERDVVECNCRSEECRTILWMETQADEIFYEYNKEDKLGRLGSAIYKGIRFNTK